VSADVPVIVEDHNQFTTLVINRPHVHNALNARVIAELDAAIVRALARSSTRAIVVTGMGDKAFSAGADLDELADLSAERAVDLLASGQQLMRRIAHCPVPVIAAVNGVALGGGFEVALAATFAVVAKHASFGLPEAGLGLIPGYGGTQRLPALVGTAVAAHVMLVGERISAARAFELGLTPIEPVAREHLRETAQELAQAVASKGPRAIRFILRAMRTSAEGSEPGFELEAALAALATCGTEASAGINAFLDKRRPEFADFDAAV
jgi:enoyl-CoA hydratase